MVGDKFGHIFDRPLENVARKISLTPNTITVAGFLVTVIASAVLSQHLLYGGILILLGGVFDILDGVVARVNGKKSRFGAFLDSVLDRYSDALILVAIAWNLLRAENSVGLLLCLGSLIGSFLISYARARAEGLGETCTHGLLERPERLILIAFGAITGLMIPVLWLLLILTHVTVLQRMYYVWRLMEKKS